MSRILPYLRSFRRIATPCESDGELLRRFRLQRDEQAFATLVHRHGPVVLGIARRIVGQAELAEDVFQAAFLVLAQRAKQLEAWPSVAGWLVQVTRRTALQAKAKAARRLRHEEQAAAMMTSTTTSDPTHSAKMRDLAEELDRELERLPDKYRTPLVLCHLQGRTKQEAAQQLGWPVGSVSGRLARGKELLKARLLRRGAVPTLVTGLLAVPRLEAAIPSLLVQATTILATSIVHKTAPIPASAAIALAHGVMTSMFLTKLKWVVATLLVLTLGVSGGVLAWSGQADSSAVQAQAPKIETKPGTLLEQLQGLWTLDDVNGTAGSWIIVSDGSVRNAHKWWQFQGNQLHKSDVSDVLSFSRASYGFELKEDKIPAHFDLISQQKEQGILKLEGEKLVISLPISMPLQGIATRPKNFEKSDKSTVYSLHRANDYDRFEGIWRREEGNPVTGDLDSAEELIFRKNMYVRRSFSFSRMTSFSEDIPRQFILNESANPKSIDMDIADANKLKAIHALRFAPLNIRSLHDSVNRNQYLERKLGIYEVPPNQLKLAITGSIPFALENDDHFVPNPKSPLAKRPASFVEAGDKVQIYKRVDSSLRDKFKVPSDPSGQTPITSAPNPDPVPAPSAKLQDLRQQRLKLTQQRLEIVKREYPNNRMTFEDLAKLSQQVLDSKLALAKDKKEKIQALEEQLRLMKEIADLTEQREQGKSKAPVLAAQLCCVELEIQIEELKAQP